MQVDDLDKDIAAALTSTAEAPPSPANAEPPPASEAPPDKTAEKPPGAERPRAEDGKFIAKKSEPPAPAKDAKTTTTPEVPPVQSAAPKVAAPANWKGNGKVEWNRLPQHVQKEIADDYARLSQTDGELSKLKAAIGPRAQVLAATYGSVEQGLQNLFAISDMATQNPAGFILWFAQQRGINLAQMVQGAMQQGEQQPSQQQPNPYEQKITQLESALTQFLNQQQQSTVSQLQNEIDNFAKDDAHPYFNDVREDMGVLIGNGRAKSLQEAYEKAVWAHPEARQSLLAAERSQALGTNAQKVQQARQAAGSLTGSPSGAAVPTDEPENSLEAEIAKQVSRFRA